MKKLRLLMVSIAAILFAIFVFHLFACSEKSEKQPLNSIEIIQKDLADREIDYQTSLVYSAYAVFGFEKLPKKYRSSEILYDGDAIFSDIMLNWDKISAETKNRLAPFYSNPSLRNSSFWQTALAKDEDFEIIPTAHALEPQIPNEILPSLEPANGKIKIWFFEKDRAKAKTVLNAFDVDKIYEKEKNYMGKEPLPDYAEWGDDLKLDIYLVDMTVRGACVGILENGNKAKCHIFLNRKYSGKEIKAYAAHELFHAIQCAIDATEPNWWKEMTAAWSEHLIYPDGDTEHDYLKNFFKDFHIYQAFTTADMRHEYGEWVFPLYLTQAHGENIIKQIWSACEPSNKNALTALDETLPNGLENDIKEFAPWVWNKNPVKKFKDNGRDLDIFPDIEDTRIKEGPRVVAGEPIEPLGIGIERFYIKEEDKSKIRSVDFDLSILNQKYPYLGIWAIIKIKSKDPYKEDWSGTGYHSFCFDLPEEDLEEVVVIIANTHTSRIKAGEDAVKYTTHNMGCSAKLNLTWQKQWDLKADLKFTNIPKPGFMKTEHKSFDFGHLEVVFKEIIEDEEFPQGDKKFVPKGGFSHTMNYSGSGSAGVNGVYQMGGNAGMSSSVSDIWDGSNEKSKNGYAILRFYLHEPEREEISQDDLSMIPEGMRQQLMVLQNMAKGIQQNMKIEKPREGELQMDIRLYFGDLPAISRGTGGGGQTTYTPPEIEFKQIFKEDETEIDIDKVLLRTDMDGELRVYGKLRLKHNQN